METFFAEADLLHLQKMHLFFLWQVLMHTKMFLKAPVNHCLLSSAIKLLLTALGMKCSPCCGWDSEDY